MEQTLAKARRHLAEQQTRLARGRTRRPRAAAEAEIAEILRPAARWLDRVITWRLMVMPLPASGCTGAPTWPPSADWPPSTSASASCSPIVRTGPWPDVIAADRAQADVEAGFRQLKDPNVVSFSPIYHWTDQKIRVHVLYCVLALAVAHLLRAKRPRPASL